MNKNRKNLHKAAVNVLGLTIASVMAAGAVVEVATPMPVFAAQTQKKEIGKTIYLDGSAKASKTADGTTRENAVRSFGRALELAGEQGEIIISGTVTIESEVKLTIPSGVTVKKDKDFKGKIVKLSGKGKLILSGKGITAEDVDVTSAEAGKEAFQIKEKEEKPDTEQQEPGKEEAQTEKQEPETQPEEPKPEEETENKPESKPEPETPQEEAPKPEPETQPEMPEPEQEEEKVPEQKPEEQPEKPQEEPEQKPEEKITLEIPEKVILKTVKEWKDFDFAAAGFAGNGTFAWEEEKEPEKYETERKVRFTPDEAAEAEYSKLPGWDTETKTIVRSVKVQVEDLKEPEQQENGQTEKPEEEQKQDQVTDTKPEEDKNQPEETVKPEEKPEQENTGDKEDPENQKEEVTIIPVDPDAVVEEPEKNPETPVNSAQPGKLGEVTEEIPESIPVGSLIDESGVQVSADFLPFYVDLQVTYNEAVNELPDAGIGEILSAYELKLWDLKEDTEYKIPEGKKVKVLIPLPENADCYSDLAIAHYLGNNQYEYFIFDKEGKVGNMTVEKKDGQEYLAFETASFSPFNVGGHQIVGPGTNSSGHKAPSGGSSAGGTGNSGSSAGTSTGAGNGTGSAAGNSQNSQNSQTSGTASPQKKPAQTATSGNSNGTTVIYTVKTGDGTEIARYVMLGAGALALGAGTVVFGKKKKESK